MAVALGSEPPRNQLFIKKEELVKCLTEVWLNTKCAEGSCRYKDGYNDVIGGRLLHLFWPKKK